MELLPCPFCGSDDIDPEGWHSKVADGPSCVSCGGMAESVELWNKQHLRARNAELEAKVDRLKHWKHLTTCHEPYKAAGATWEQRHEDDQKELERLRKALTRFAEKAFLADTDGDLKTMSNFQSGGLFIADHVAKIAKAALGDSDGN